eukprot:1950242-Amphidinium_carterae.1
MLLETTLTTVLFQLHLGSANPTTLDKLLLWRSSLEANLTREQPTTNKADPTWARCRINNNEPPAGQ